jgi:prepilin-type N-terminal cleavage/methylation domain-containing protein
MLSLGRSQRGDTIVEVMIAIVVVSMVLVAAYVTTTHNINGLQDTQEHSQALQLAQTQLEHLHNATTEPTNHQCFNNAGGITSGVSCKVDASGNPTTSQLQYTIDITNNSPPTFQVTITWASLDNGGVTNNVTLYYQP